MSDNIKINTLDMVHAFLATPRGIKVAAAMGDPDMRQRLYFGIRDAVCEKYPHYYPVDPGAWSSEIKRQVAMYVREFVDQWAADVSA